MHCAIIPGIERACPYATTFLQGQLKPAIGEVGRGQGGKCCDHKPQRHEGLTDRSDMPHDDEPDRDVAQIERIGLRTDRNGSEHLELGVGAMPTIEGVCEWDAPVHGLAGLPT